VVSHPGRKAKRVGEGDPGKKAAKAAAAKIQAKLALGDLSILEVSDKPIQGPTVEEVAKEWERVAYPNWKRGTQITYGNALRCRLLPAFGKLAWCELTPACVEAWWTKTREEGLSRRRLDILRRILREICRRAVRLGLLATNRVEYIEGKLGREDTEVRRGDYLTGEDLARLLDTAERVCPKEYPIFLVMATGGLRIGEAVGLQVGYLDAPGLQVHIRRMVRRGYIKQPQDGKGACGGPPGLHRGGSGAGAAETRQAEAAYEGTEARWLFPGREAGLPITPEAVQQAFSKVLRAAGIRRIRPHDLRHTYATLAIQAGVPLLTVSRQLGHASISTTVGIYAHAVPGSNRAAADALEAVLTRNQTQPPRNPTA
jgi:integrase